VARPVTALDALLVALGACAGAPLRYLVSHWSRAGLHAVPTVGTILVNLVGSLVLGLFVGSGIDGHWYALIGVGFCGALTTFSTLALEIWDAMTDRRRPEAVLNVALSLLLGIGAAWLGYVLAR
jgi:CrcB protein